MTDDKFPPNTPENAPGNSGSRWEPDPAAPVEGVAAAPVPPVDPAYDPASPGAPAAPPAPAARRRPSRTQALTGGIAAAALVVGGGLGLAVGHVTAGDDHGRDGFSDVSFQQGDHGLPPDVNGVPAPGQPPLGDDDDGDTDADS
ncbi:hypothetical protein [Nocardioides taihuensis]|uniref:Uncharacterized protein n=1 Tax=Nocardioides taihuensis TaxID=1835606 RepID=A0ABW0BH47_9ACTN